VNKKEKLPERYKSFLPLKSIYILIFAVILASIVYLSNNIFTKIINEYKISVYEDVNEKILSNYQLLLNEKINNSFVLATSISKYKSIQEYLLSKQTTDLNLQSFLEEMHTKKEYVDIEIEVISKEGVSLARSWTTEVGDNVFQNNVYLNHLIKEPKSITSAEVSKFGMSISNKIPIYNKNEIIGFFGMNIQFDDMLEKFEAKGFKSIILLNTVDSKNINQEMSYSHKFIDDIYVVNKNADDYITKLIKQSGVETYFLSTWIKTYKIDESSGYLISKLKIKNIDGYPLANVFIFKNIDEIEMKNIDMIQKLHIATTLLVILFIAFILNFIYALSKTKLLGKDNRSLIVENEELIIKTNEMDFNDKKLENLFNMQPNLMIMHNGKEITQANKRFIGFFNRFETFEGFRQKHKCVSELFKEFNAPNYIHEQTIEGQFWIDYILSNPKRLYKVVIPYKDSKVEKDHHFIIKLNEMTYAGKVDERLIIVALVDITQDLVNYKNFDKGIDND
jgi:hypothetical protein